MIYTTEYLNNNFQKVTWRSPSNIALVKYWGKRNIQLPMNPSLSMTLSESYTETTLYFREKNNIDSSVDMKYFFDGKEEENFAARVRKFLTSISDFSPFLFEYELIFYSSNSFPHSAGIASSASAFSAIALCLGSLKTHALSVKVGMEEVSHLSRLGSGSACRSVYGGLVSWGATKHLTGSSDEFATPIDFKIHKNFQNMHDSILIVDRQPKTVSSSSGHKLMEGHPYASVRFKHAFENHHHLLGILRTGDFKAFAEIVEQEALSIHALMITSSPSFFLMKPNTLMIIEKVKAFRENTGIPVCFTLDAGPNVHLIYPEPYLGRVVKFINDELKVYCMEGNIIHDKIGIGPELINK